MAAEGVALRFAYTDYTPEQERLISTVLGHPAGARSARGGVRPGTDLTCTISGSSPEVVNTPAWSGVINDLQGGGSYLVSFPAGTLQLPTRPGSGSSRITEVVARILNGDHRPGDGTNADPNLVTRKAELYLVSGSTGSSPTDPSIPAGQERIRRLLIPAGSAAISQVAVHRHTVAVGGVLPVSSAAQQAAIEVPYDGMQIYRTDLKLRLSYNGAAWVPDRLAGKAQLTFPAGQGSTNTLDVTFAVPFPTAPQVVATNNTIFGAYAVAGLVTTTGFRLIASAPTAPGTAQTIDVSWVAVP